MSMGAASVAACAVRNGRNVGNGVMPSGADRTEGVCGSIDTAVGAAAACGVRYGLSAAAIVKLHARLAASSTAQGSASQRASVRSPQLVDRSDCIFKNLHRHRVCADCRTQCWTNYFIPIAGTVLLFVVVRVAKTAFDALRLAVRGQRPRAAAPGLLAALVLWGVRVIKCALPWRCGAPLCRAGRAAAAGPVVRRQLGARPNLDCRR